MSAATRVARKRFESCTSDLLSATSTSFPPQSVAAQDDVYESLQDLVGPVDDTWAESVNKLSQLNRPLEGSNIAMSMWHLVHGGYVDYKIVEDYLELLRPTSSHVEILPLRILSGDHNSIDEAEGIDHPTIIPFFCQGHWAFAVAYSDCVHWYDSAPGSAENVPLLGGTRPIIEGWQSPLHRNTADAGVLMLMGIKLILQRKPHLSQGVADKLIQPFRAGTFVELLCRKINPSPAEFRCIDLERVIETGDISPAGNQMIQQTALACGSVQRPLMEDGMFVTDPADPEPYNTLTSMADPVPLCKSPMMRPATDPESLIEPSTTQTQHPANISRRRKSPSAFTNGRADSYMCDTSDDRKIILDNLSHGMHFKRSALVSVDDDPFVLWALLRYSRASGNLHRRYHAVLFHNMMKDEVRQKQMASSMGSKAKSSISRDLWSWKFWKKVSDVGVDNGLGPYVTLCAFRNDFSGYRLSEEAQNPLIERLQDRLQDDSDMLRMWLQEAAELCKIILLGPTPVSLFEIDKYNFQAEFQTTDDNYKTFVDPEPHRGPNR
ncbi:hypothetical protein FGRA07_11390 [Fusarium graminearum]|uniref:Uncharacterized protein n=1 Tax=Gibberella zeae TaxID=5518 RepID=A0A2H3GAZ7_GIBZA|nr:hypothetical protein FGRA07_11390 [Fusarium graminearum]